MDSLDSAAQKRIRKAIENTLAAYLNSLSNTETPPTKEQLETPYLPEIDPAFVRETGTLISTALLMGMDHARNNLRLADGEIPALPFEEAAAFMKSRVPVTKAEWNALEPKLRFRAFTVARLAQCDYIDTARQVLSKALESGKGVAETYKQWQSIQTLSRDDALRLRPGYWENVFRTNTQTAYVAGKLMRFRDNPPPAWRLLIIDDSRTSDICRGLIHDGKDSLVLTADHPFWKTFGFPPYHYQCRTGIQAVYNSQIADGVMVENPALESLRERFKPMDGFGGNPLDKESWYKLTPGMIDRAVKYGIVPDLVDLAKQLGIKDFAVAIPSVPETIAVKDDIINMGKLGEKLPADFINGMKSKLEQAPESVRKAWNNMVDSLQIVESDYRGSIGPHHSPAHRGIFFDYKRDSEMRIAPPNVRVEPKYSTAFHELFHNISSVAGERAGRTRFMDFSAFFESKKYSGTTLGQMLHSEAEERINKVFDSLKNEAAKKGLARSSVSKRDVYRLLNKEITDIPLYEHCDISDMWDGCTNHKVQGLMGHTGTYWKDHDVGAEAFAEMGKATVNHPESLKRIKEYFPKSYNIFLEMLDEIGGW